MERGAIKPRRQHAVLCKIIDAEALELEDGTIIKGIVLNEGKPAIVEAEVADGVGEALHKT